MKRLVKHAAHVVFLYFLGIAASYGGVYTWKDAQGQTHYGDRPPAHAQEKKLSGNVIEVSKLPFAVSAAAVKFPVTLYSTGCGAPCDQARTLLQSRGVPFAAQDPEAKPEAAKALKKQAGALEVPVLSVGSRHVKGFEAGEWNALLDAAGYPGARNNH